MGRKHMGKGEICSLRAILLFPQCFQKTRFPGASKGVIVWEWVKVPFMTDVAFVASADQDQAAQNVQSDLKSTLSAFCNNVNKSNHDVGLEFWAKNV